LWDLTQAPEQPRHVSTIRTSHTQNILAVRFFTDTLPSTHVATGAFDGKIGYYDIANGKEIAIYSPFTYRRPCCHRVSTVPNSPNLVYGAFSSGDLVMVDVRTAQHASLVIRGSAFKELYAATVNPVTPHLVACVGDSAHARVYDVRQPMIADQVCDFRPASVQYVSTGASACDCAWDHEGRRLAVTYVEDNIYTFDMDKSSTSGISLDAESHTVAATSSHSSASASQAAGSTESEASGAAGEEADHEQAGDGRESSSSDNSDVDNSYLTVCRGHLNLLTYKEVTWTPHSRYIVTGDDSGSVFFYDGQSGQLEHILDHADGDVVNSIDFHPTEPIMYTSGLENAVKAWSVRTGDVVPDRRTAPVSGPAVEAYEGGEEGTTYRACLRERVDHAARILAQRSNHWRYHLMQSEFLLTGFSPDDDVDIELLDDEGGFASDDDVDDDDDDEDDEEDLEDDAEAEEDGAVDLLDEVDTEEYTDDEEMNGDNEEEFTSDVSAGPF
jgi:WD40 repeat protein